MFYQPFEAIVVAVRWTLEGEQDFLEPKFLGKR